MIAEVEYDLVARLLMAGDSAILKHSGSLSPYYFTVPELGKAYAAMVNAATIGAPSFTAVCEVSSSLAHNLAIHEPLRGVTITDQVNAIRKEALRRGLRETIRGVESMVDSQPELAVELLRNVGDSFETKETKPVLSAVSEWDSIYADARKRDGGLIGVPTGYSKLDDLTSGLWPGWTVIVGAETGGGKTAFLSGIAATAVAKKTPGIIISTEMTRRATMLRIVSWITGVPTMNLLQGDLRGRDPHDIRDAFDSIDRSGVIIRDDVRDIGDILRACRQSVKSGGKWVTVDFVQNVAVKGASSIFERTSEAGIQLQGAAIDLNVPFIIASQLSNAKVREGVSEGPLEFRGAGELAHAADLALILQRDKDKMRRHIMGVLVRKFRHGRVGTFDMEFVRNWTRLEVIENSGDSYAS